MKNGMSRWKRVALGLILLLGAASAKAEAPAHCSYGYQDSSCLGPQSRAAQTPPQCSIGPGWTTVAAAVWQGSKFSAPQCNYQAPPTCAPGYDQYSAPVWDGSNWVGLSCIPQAPPVSPPTQIAACAAAPTFQGWAASFGGHGLGLAAILNSSYAFGSAGTMTGAASLSNVYTPIVQSEGDISGQLGCWGSTVTSVGSMPGASDGNLYEVYVSDATETNTGTGGNDIVAASICWAQHGTNNVAYLLNIGMMKNPGTCH